MVCSDNYTDAILLAVLDLRATCPPASGTCGPTRGVSKDNHSDEVQAFMVCEWRKKGVEPYLPLGEENEFKIGHLQCAMALTRTILATFIVGKSKPRKCN